MDEVDEQHMKLNGTTNVLASSRYKKTRRKGRGRKGVETLVHNLVLKSRRRSLAMDESAGLSHLFSDQTEESYSSALLSVLRGGQYVTRSEARGERPPKTTTFNSQVDLAYFDNSRVLSESIVSSELAALSLGTNNKRCQRRRRNSAHQMNFQSSWSPPVNQYSANGGSHYYLPSAIYPRPTTPDMLRFPAPQSPEVCSSIPQPFSRQHPNYTPVMSCVNKAQVNTSENDPPYSVTLRLPPSG
eukprot:GHVH01001936.1.p1 GENE.GHVH01001936.1~~GHVH01001936.1.p1  ORF type:complete len:243 (+),score=24.19 GHVH01001936.1:217-945(+)